MSQYDRDSVSRMPNPNISGSVPAASDPSFWGAGNQCTFLVTSEQSGGTYYAIEATVPPAGGPAPHLHRLEHESLYVLQGTLDVVIDDKRALAAAGDFVHIPCDTMHSFRNIGDTTARVLLIFSLDDAEYVFGATPRTPEGRAAAPDRPERGAPTSLYAMLARLVAVPRPIPQWI